MFCCCPRCPTPCHLFCPQFTHEAQLAGEIERLQAELADKTEENERLRYRNQRLQSALADKAEENEQLRDTIELLNVALDALDLDPEKVQDVAEQLRVSEAHELRGGGDFQLLLTGGKLALTHAKRRRVDSTIAVTPPGLTSHFHSCLPACLPAVLVLLQSENDDDIRARCAEAEVKAHRMEVRSCSTSSAMALQGACGGAGRGGGVVVGSAARRVLAARTWGKSRRLGMQVHNWLLLS
jgi:regulator of replication initiation timing